MTHTENYNLTLVEGSDTVNLLTQMNPNTTAIDTQMKDNADHGIQDATELFTSSVHAITRQNPDAPIFRFTAVSNFTAGETFTVDGVQVTALLTSGEALTTGSFIIGSEVICALRDTLLTVFVNAGTAAIAKNAEKLGGELPEYYGTAEDVADAVESATTALETANGANTAVGNLSSLTTATKTSVVGAVNEVNENLTKLQHNFVSATEYDTGSTFEGKKIYKTIFKVSASGDEFTTNTFNNVIDLKNYNLNCITDIDTFISVTTTTYIVNGANNVLISSLGSDAAAGLNANYVASARIIADSILQVYLGAYWASAKDIVLTLEYTRK